MHISPRLRIAFLATAIGVVPIVLALTLPALPGVHADSGSADSSAISPQQVADTLDSIVQPRFQQNAGQFGEDRVMHGLDGHQHIEWIDSNSHFERRRFAAVKASHRSYVMAFLHCRHKPGAHVDPPTKPEPLSDEFKPSTDALIAVGGTEAGANNTFDWANKALQPLVLPFLKPLKQGLPVTTEYENWVIVMRPVRAEHQSCVSCHVGTHRGDTLGIMVYAVDKNAKIKGKSFTWDGGGV